jgi:RHS repeat-associated protein
MCCPLAKTWENPQTTPPSGVFLCKKNTSMETFAIFELSRKEQDEETGFYYYGARYLNPKTSMWISADPAMGDYIPSAPASDEAKKRNENLPGMGGVYNYANFHVYHYAGNNPVKYVDPDGEAIDSKQFLRYTLGYEVYKTVENTKISSTNFGRAWSVPWGTIYIPVNDNFQGRYNPDYKSGKGPPSETGRIGLETHELWHQVQYDRNPITALVKLIIEGIQDFFGYSPYDCGNPLRPGVLASIKTLSDIPTLEGQAQFIGQWNADVHQYLSGGKIDMNRLRQEAQIIINSGYHSPAASGILMGPAGEEALQ